MVSGELLLWYVSPRGRGEGARIDAGYRQVENDVFIKLRWRFGLLVAMVVINARGIVTSRWGCVNIFSMPVWLGPRWAIFFDVR